MPRPSKGARLYVKRLKGRAPVYVIRDGAKEISTGCALDDVERASQALREYLARNYRPETHERQLSNIGCADVLMLYFKDLPADSPSRETIKYHVKALNAYWGDKSLADVKGSTCREYIAQRTKTGPTSSLQKKDGPTSWHSAEQSLRRTSVKCSTARQELKTFQAAINHWHRESPLEAVPKVTLPKAESRRERWLTRNEVAALLKACRRLSREGRKAAKGATQFTDYSHVARFILIGIYTGTRHDAILRLRWSASESGGHADLERNIIYRRGKAERDTSKRRPPARLQRHMVNHLERWRRKDLRDCLAVQGQHVIHVHGHPIAKMRRAWNTVRKAAGLGEDVTPHTLRHTATSWLLWGREAKGARPAQKPLTIWETAEVIGADASTVERVYGHHRKPE
jgi:integrase